MHLTGADFLPDDRHNLPLTRNVGDALAAIALRLFPEHTAKKIATRWKLDPETGRNLVKGKGGTTVLTKAVVTERDDHDAAWDLWIALGESIIGEKLTEYQERKLNEIIEKNENAVRLYQANLARSRALDERTAKLVALDDRVAS